MIRMSRLAALLGVTYLIACGGITDSPGGRSLMSFSAARQDSAVVEGASIVPGLRRVTVNGRFIAPNSCQVLQPEADADGANLTLTITAFAQLGPCSGSAGYFTYLGILGNFAPGQYHLRVFHRDTRGIRTVFDGNLTIES